MSGGLSSNWKNLQAKIKQDLTNPPRKRRREELDFEDQLRKPPAKKPKPSPTLGRGKPRFKSMGNSHSSRVDKVSLHGTKPTEPIDPEATKVSSEHVGDLFGLGLGRDTLLNLAPERDNEGHAPNIEPGKYISIDCEMVGVGQGGYRSVLARASVVDFYGRQVYDSYVMPQEPVVDWRTHITGITPRHMARARKFDEVQEHIAALIKNRIVVGHDLIHDMQVLELSHPQHQRRDTAMHPGFRKHGHGPKPALRTLAERLLGIEIHQGTHSSIQDGRVAMAIFRKHKSDFDARHLIVHGEDSSTESHGGGEGKGVKGKNRSKGKKKGRR